MIIYYSSIQVNDLIDKLAELLDVRAACLKLYKGEDHLGKYGATLAI
jgi:hypothetical protein